MHYWASPLEASLGGGQEVALVGAVDSAGRVVVYLASRDRAELRANWDRARQGHPLERVVPLE